jgi:methyl-branched lipid omega-hydroxylase
MVALVEEGVRRQAASVVDGVLERHPEGECDFVQEIASALPLRVICDMMGVPTEDHRRILAWTNVILGAGDPDYGGTLDDLLRASFEINEYAQRLGEERRRHPRADVVSELMQATVEGEELTPEEFGSFFILLAVAGNETTRNAISHGMKALTDNPDQRRAWWDAFETMTPTAVEEIVRWASPVMYFRRTATADTELAGTRIREGDKLALFYISANRDESRFADPFTFDVGRDPNPQIGFGAGGPHFCLGASLARREIAVMFDEIRRRLPDLVVTGEPAMLSSQFVNGVKRMPCAWGPAAR